jgi:hypothetical protein
VPSAEAKGRQTLGTTASTLFLAEDYARLSQIVRRQLDLNLISGHDSNEMLAHFTGNMRKHIARAWEIDPKHRSW